MRKKIIRQKNIQLECGKAKPGATLASFGINMPNFCREFNEKSKGWEGIVNVKVIVYEDKTYNFFIKGNPTTELIRKMIGEKKVITKSELQQLVQVKLSNLNTEDFEKAQKIIMGVIKSHNIEIKE